MRSVLSAPIARNSPSNRCQGPAPTSPFSRIKSPVLCPGFVLGLAGTRRLLEQIEEVKNEHLIPLCELGAACSGRAGQSGSKSSLSSLLVYTDPSALRHKSGEVGKAIGCGSGGRGEPPAPDAKQPTNQR